MTPCIFVENNDNIETFDKINETISNTNTKLIKQSENGNTKYEDYNALSFNVGKLDIDIGHELVTIFDMQNLLVDAKDMIIRKLEKAKGVASTFVRTSKGYKVTKVEGFVAIDQVGKAVKLVDRLEFAHQNFSAAKNWTK